MIKANELRIGNWMYNPFDEAYVQVKSINESGINEEWDGSMEAGYKISKQGNSAEDLDPISLTPEILEKCGFEKRLLNDSFFEYYLGCTPPGYKKGHEHKLSYFDTNGLSGLNWKPYESGTIHSFPCECLHQLQNLFYALTGEELTVNL